MHGQQDAVTWERISQLFDEALALPQPQRDIFLDRECGSDMDLRSQIEALLAHDPVAESDLLATVSAAAESLSNTIESTEGGRIGAYSVVREIGRGGMGIVYLAQRSDGQFQQQVAIKVIRHGLDSEYLLNRFRYERRILARLNHSNIARILDGGTTADGRPYLVMDYIEGQPLLEYCAARNLGTRQKLRLFLDLCAAVQHAHQRTVIHRDIKPGNIMVTADGVAKLLDFGIAKVLEAEADSPNAPTMQMLTPDYASPEQVRGQEVTAASDIYSLGAVLYQLLTGKSPHRFADRSALSIAKTICDTEPLRPSTAAPEIRRELRGDLDNIVRMAMRKEPERRYNSVAQLAEDILRHLDGRPVIAAPATLAYRTSKFLARYRWGVAAAAMVVLSMVAGTVVSVREARRADRRFQEVRAMANTFLFQVNDKVLALPGSTGASELLVSTGLKYLDGLAKEAAGDASLQAELALAYIKVGDVQGNPTGPNLGHHDQALASYRKGLSIGEALRAAGNADRKVLRALSLGYLKTGDLLLRTGDTRGGLASYENGTAVAERVHAIEPDYGLMANSYSRLFDADWAMGNTSAAYDAAKKSLAVAEAWDAAKPLPKTRYSVGICLARLAMAMSARGDLPGALATARRGEQVLQPLVDGPKPEPPFRRGLINTREVVALVSGNPWGPNLGDPAMARAYYAKNLAIAQEDVRSDPENRLARWDVALAYGDMGSATRDIDPGASAASFRQALSLLDAELAIADTAKNRHLVATTRTRAAWSFFHTGDRRAAMEQVSRAVKEESALVQQDPQSVFYQQGLVASQTTHGRLSMESDDSAASRAMLTEAAQGAAKLYRDQPGNFESAELAGTAWEALAVYERRFGTASSACDWARRSVELWRNWPQHGISSVYDQGRLRQATALAIGCN